MTFATRVLIADPCSVTNTASDDEFSNPNEYSKKESWVSTFLLLLVWQAGTKSSSHKFQHRCDVPSSMQSVRRRLSVAAAVAPVH